MEKRERVFLIIIIYIIYYIYNYDSIFSNPKTLMTLMTNDIDDINDIQRHNIEIRNYLTIPHLRNTADGRSGQSGSFKAGKSERPKSMGNGLFWPSVALVNNIYFA